MSHQSSNLSKHTTGNPVVRGLLDGYFRTLLGLVEPLAPKRVLDVGCGEGVTAARFRGDEVQLGRVVANLADNAERYARHQVKSVPSK